MSINRTSYSAIADRSHRVSTALKALGIGAGDRVATLAWNSERHMECWYGVMGIGPDDVVMPIVPMFHANAWGLAFACPAAGAKVVMPGGQLDGASVFELLDSERVTFSAAVPTVWLGLLQHLREHKLELPYLQRVVIGGAALPEAILRAFRDDFGVEVVHAWGMTETSPVGTIGGRAEAIQGG